MGRQAMSVCVCTKYTKRNPFVTNCSLLFVHLLVCRGCCSPCNLWTFTPMMVCYFSMCACVSLYVCLFVFTTTKYICAVRYSYSFFAIFLVCDLDQEIWVARQTLLSSFSWALPFTILNSMPKKIQSGNHYKFWTKPKAHQ